MAFDAYEILKRGLANIKPETPAQKAMLEALERHLAVGAGIPTIDQLATSSGMTAQDATLVWCELETLVGEALPTADHIWRQ